MVVLGTQVLIDEALRAKGKQPVYVGGYRITDKDTLNVAIEEVGKIRTACEQFLSRVRRGRRGLGT